MEDLQFSKPFTEFHFFSSIIKFIYLLYSNIPSTFSSQESLLSLLCPLCLLSPLQILSFLSLLLTMVSLLSLPCFLSHPSTFLSLSLPLSFSFTNFGLFLFNKIYTPWLLHRRRRLLLLPRLLTTSLILVSMGTLTIHIRRENQGL